MFVQGFIPQSQEVQEDNCLGGGVDPEWQFTRQWQCLPGLPMEAGITVAAVT